MTDINLGDFQPAINTMGPGKRAGIWVKGCTIECRGCITQKLIPRIPENIVSVQELCTRIEQAKEMHHISGISISGGEPFEQAEALAEVAQHARKLDLTVIAWSGYTRSHLESARARAGSRHLLQQLDVLIDGPFIANRASHAPALRGSSNQRIHLLTDAHTLADLEHRVISAHVTDTQVVITGVHHFAASHTLMKLFGIT